MTRVSLRFYGTKAMWPYIVKHNPKVIKNPNNVPYGTTIEIPELTKEYVMIQGGCRFSKDIPPYIIAGREPIAYSGINIIGLRRRGFSNEIIENIHNAYRIIYQSGLNTSDALTKVEAEVPASPEIEYIVDFIRNSERGIIR